MSRQKRTEAEAELCRKIGQRIAYLRKERGISLKNMAFIMDLSTSFYGAMEKGRSEFNLGYLLFIHDILGVKMADIFEVVDGKMEPLTNEDRKKRSFMLDTILLRFMKREQERKAKAKLRAKIIKELMPERAERQADRRDK